MSDFNMILNPEEAEAISYVHYYRKLTHRAMAGIDSLACKLREQIEKSAEFQRERQRFNRPLYIEKDLGL